MPGFLIGLALGAAALYFLARATRAIVGGDINAAFLPLSLNILSILGLLPVALFLRHQLLYAGIGMPTALVLGALGIWIRKIRKDKRS